jgi:hypothetical protein
LVPGSGGIADHVEYGGDELIVLSSTVRIEILPDHLPFWTQFKGPASIRFADQQIAVGKDLNSTAGF